MNSTQQVQLQGYFNPQAVPKRIMGVLYLPGTAGSQPPLPMSHAKSPVNSQLVFFFTLHSPLMYLSIMRSFLQVATMLAFAVPTTVDIYLISLTLSYVHPRSQS